MKRWIAWLGIELDVVSRREKLVAALGGFAAIFLLVWISGFAPPGSTAVVASMGASAVLLFAIPHGPLSQPWPVVGGHLLSATIGVACARWIGPAAMAGGVAVGLSILAMHLAKCIHPPGGATAFATVIGGEAVASAGFSYIVFPVLANGVAMVTLAVIFNWWVPWRRYPAAASTHPGKLASDETYAPTHDEIVAALRKLDVFIDVSEDDLVELCRNLSKRPEPKTKVGARSAA